MTTLSKSLSDVFSDYKEWITRNPSKVRTWESRIYNILYVLLGKFYNTKLQAEWLKSAFRLISLFNGLIILHSPTKKPYVPAERVNICITVLEHCEIALEKSAQQLWGAEGRWSIIMYLQLIKFLAKMTLILHFKEKIIGHPYAELGSNIKIQANTNSQDPVDYRVGSNHVLKLKRSGRIIRTVASAPPLCNRLWKPPIMDLPVCPTLNGIDDEEKIMQVMGEALYIIKPIVNLALIKKLGPRSWKQWTFSLFMDLLSLHLLEYPSRRRNMSTGLTPVQMSIIAQRRSDLLFYFIRSPFFQSRIANPLYLILYMIPYIGPPLSDELRFYLSSYFFLWST